MKKLIIAGNAPSLKEIDYTRLPMDFDVFRCNQFYFEDKYYLGKHTKAVFHNICFFIEQYYTSKQLIANQEYQIQNIVLSNFELNHIEDVELMGHFHHYFPDVIKGYDKIKKLKEFDAFVKYNEIYLESRITSGIYMCAFAIALGYKEIYLAGIDFYQKNGDGGGYAFDSKTSNLSKLGFTGVQGDFHTQETELKALDLLAKTYDVRFYSLCPKSPLSKFIELAPIISANPSFIPESKPKNYTKDILIPDKRVYKIFNEVYKNKRRDEDEEEKKQKSEYINSIYYKILKDTYKLPKHIKQFIQSRKEKRVK